MHGVLVYLCPLAYSYIGVQLTPLTPPDYSLVPGVTETFKVTSMAFDALLLSNAVTSIATQPIQQALVPSADLSKESVTLAVMNQDESHDTLKRITPQSRGERTAREWPLGAAWLPFLLLEDEDLIILETGTTFKKVQKLWEDAEDSMAFGRIMRDPRRKLILKCSKHGTLHHVEDQMALLLQLHERRAESRAIVTRKRGAKTPTWDGYQPAFIVHPAIWYFDPNSRVQQMGGKGSWPEPRKDWIAVPQENDGSGARRNLLDFMLEVELQPGSLMFRQSGAHSGISFSSYPPSGRE